MKVILVVRNIVFFVRPYILEEKYCFGHTAVSILRAETGRSEDTLIRCNGACLTYTKVHAIRCGGARPQYTKVHGAVTRSLMFEFSAKFLEPGDERFTLT